MRDVGRLIGLRIGVRHVIGERSDRGRARRRLRRLAVRDRRGVAAGDQPRRRRLDVAFDARHLPGEQQVRAMTRLPRRQQHFRSADIRVAMHHAEANELGVLEPRNHPQHARLVTPFDLRLEADQAVVDAAAGLPGQHLTYLWNLPRERFAGAVLRFPCQSSPRCPVFRRSRHPSQVVGRWAPAEIDVLREALRASSVVIADGHHRYETALAYHAEQNGHPGGHDAVMCFCVDADAEDLVVWPYHRLLRTGASAEEIADRIGDRWSVRSVADEDLDGDLSGSESSHPMIFVFGDRNLLIEVEQSEVDARFSDRSRSWRSLDVVALHEVVLPAILPEGIHDIGFTKGVDEVRQLVRMRDWTGGVLLGPPKPPMSSTSRSGERMPQKASYFWPKAVTGLVFRTLR